MRSNVTFNASAHGSMRVLTPSRVSQSRVKRVKAGLTPIDSCDEYETYDSRVEKELALAKDKAKSTEFFPRGRLNGEMLKRAITDAMEICKTSDKCECAAFWDVAEELFEAYAHELDAKKEEKEDVAPWSIKVREY